LEDVSTGDGIRQVNGFFSELESAAQTLEAKFSEQSRFENVQQLLPSRHMVARALRKMHQKIIRRLQCTCEAKTSKSMVWRIFNGFTSRGFFLFK